MEFALPISGPGWWSLSDPRTSGFPTFVLGLDRKSERDMRGTDCVYVESRSRPALFRSA